MLHIPKIVVPKDAPFSTILHLLEGVSAHKIAINNWSNEFPYSPDVKFQIAHDGKNIYLRFLVDEKEILAKAKGNNSEVWTDSCVEFFISFDNSGYYYNLEQSCIGEALLGYRKEKNDATHADDNTIDAIRRLPSLGKENFELKEGMFKWTLLSIIPATSFWKSNIISLDGVKAKANFYKCGDNLTTPHFLSWAPITTNTPNFHRVDFFEEVLFES